MFKQLVLKLSYKLRRKRPTEETGTDCYVPWAFNKKLEKELDEVFNFFVNSTK